jgi:hypothetical protein
MNLDVRQIWLVGVPSRTLWKMWPICIRFYLCYLYTTCFLENYSLCYRHTDFDSTFASQSWTPSLLQAVFMMTVVSVMTMKYWCVPSYFYTKCCKNWSSQITTVVRSYIILFNDVCHYIRLESVGDILLHKQLENMWNEINDISQPFTA